MNVARFARSRCLAAIFCLLASFAGIVSARAQANQTQQLVLAGLRSAGYAGVFNSVRVDAAGNIFLLLDEKDGLRLIKTDNAGQNLLAQAYLGAKGDSGLALALDPLGNVVVAGTTSSTALTATPVAAIRSRTSTATNGFVAKFDTNLNELFLSFTGGSNIAVTGVAATADAVFVTGSAIQQMPATGSSQNGFAERFSSDGATLVYATYLTGLNGNTEPTSIAADTSDNAYVVGSTSSTGYPTVAALVPSSLSNPSGFLTKLTPAADGITFSTFVPGAGLSSIALDATGSSLLVSGSVALGQFPVDTVTTPIVPLGYQVLLRLPLDGSSVTSGTLLAPGNSSAIAPVSGGAAWVDGALTAQLLPGAPLATLGTGFAVRVSAGNTLDQTARFGGLPNLSPSFASFPINLTSIAVDPSGEPLIAGSVPPTASSALLATESYDLPLAAAPSTALPSTLRSSEETAAVCTGSLCTGGAAYLAKLNPSSSAASLVFSPDAAPLIVLRNLGSASATGLVLTDSGSSVTSNCPSTLPAGGECDALLSGSGPATLIASAGGATASVQVPAYTAASNTLAFFPKELDFGIQTSGSGAASGAVTVSNLGSTSQTFKPALDSASSTGSQFSQISSDCPGTVLASTYALAAGASCHITFGFTASATVSANGYQTAEWSINGHDVLLTAYGQAAALNVSASEVDFGTQFLSGLRAPRYLYLSNSSNAPVAHTPVTLAGSAAFTVSDSCPTTLDPASVCRIRLDYNSPTASDDDFTLTLDDGLSVLVTGKTLPTPGIGSTIADPNLTVTPTTVTFPDAVVVTSVSSAQTVAITNTGGSAFSLSLGLSGDFTDVTSCGTVLPAGQTCAVSLTFVPSQPGTRSGLLTVTAGSGFAPVYVALLGTGLPILPIANNTIAFGSVPVAQPSVLAYKVSEPLSSLTAKTTGPYTAVLVEDAGFGFGTPPASAYSTSTTGTCHDCFVGVQFTPTASGSEPGTLTLTSSGGGQAYTIALTGSGAGTSGLVLTPAAQDFGTVAVHSRGGSVLFTLTNLIATGTAVTLTPPAVSGDFTLTSDVTGGQPCTGTLAYTASCLVEVGFTPTATGTRTGTLTLATTSAGSATAALSGTGLTDPGYALSPNALTFNNVPGTTATVQTVSLTNTGSATLTLGTPAVGTTSFAVSSACPGTLAPAASCTLTVTFTPGTASATDTLSIPLTIPGSGGVTVSETASVALSGAYTSATAGLEIVPGQSTFSTKTTATLGEILQVTVNNLTAKSLALNLTLPQGYALSGAPCTTLAANGSCNVSIQFIPLTNGAVAGTLFAQGTPSDGSATLNGIGYLEGFGVASTGGLAITGPIQTGDVLNFGQVASGQSASQTVTLTNGAASGSVPVTIRRVTSTPPFLSTTSCGGSLAAGQSCSIVVTYSPINQVPAGSTLPAATADTGTLTILSDSTTSPASLNLMGQAAPIGVASPSNAGVLASYTLSQGSLVFGITPVGNTSTSQTIQLINTGSTTIHVLAVTTTANFTVGNGCGVVAAGGNCLLTVASTPQSGGTHIDSIEISSDASDSLEYVSLLSGATVSTITVTPRSLNFGPQLVGASSSAMSVLVTNTGANAATFTGITVTGDFATGGTCPAPGGTLAAGANCNVQVSFNPVATGSRTGTLSIASSGSSVPLTVALAGTGTAAELAFNPSSLVFGNVAQGSSSPQLVTLTNNGVNAITGLAFAATGDFAVTFPCSSTTLAPGASCTAQVTFTPTALGARTGTLTVTSSDPGSPAAVPLSGTGTAATGTPPATGTGKLVVAPASLAFGNIATGSTAPLTLTLANAGTANLTGITLAITGDYAITIPCTSGGGTATLLPDGACTVQVTFTPAALGPRPGTLTIASSDPASPASVVLSGTGVVPTGPSSVGAFTLTVDGGLSSSRTVTSGSPGSYALTVTPTGGFTGPVALTCTPVTPGEYTSCAIQPSSLALNGSAQNAVVQINTITAAAGLHRPGAENDSQLATTFVCTLLPGLFAFWKARRVLRRRVPVLMALLFTACSLLATGCGGKRSATTPSVLETPPGTYQYTVTASATGGVPAAQTVTLNLIVQ